MIEKKKIIPELTLTPHICSTSEASQKMNVVEFPQCNNGECENFKKDTNDMKYTVDCFSPGCEAFCNLVDSGVDIPFFQQVRLHRLLRSNLRRVRGSSSKTHDPKTGVKTVLLGAVHGCHSCDAPVFEGCAYGFCEGCHKSFSMSEDCDGCEIAFDFGGFRK